MNREGIFIQTSAQSFSFARFLALLLAISVVALTVAGCASRIPRAVPAELPLTVAHLKGQARWKTGTNDWQPVIKGQTIHAGMVIETAQNSRVDVLIKETAKREQSAQTASSLNRTDLRQVEPAPPPPQLMGLQPRYSHWPLDFFAQRSPGSVGIRIWDNTRLALSELKRSATQWRKAEVGKMTLDLQGGHIFVYAAKLSAGAEFEVTLPTCSASVRGTIFDINVDGIIMVADGSVFVTGTNYSQVVQSQQIFDARTRVLSPLPQYD